MTETEHTTKYFKSKKDCARYVGDLLASGDFTWITITRRLSFAGYSVSAVTVFSEGTSPRTGSEGQRTT